MLLIEVELKQFKFCSRRSIQISVETKLFNKFNSYKQSINVS